MNRVAITLFVALLACGGCEETEPAQANAAKVVIVPRPPVASVTFTTLLPEETGIDVVMVSGEVPSTQIVEVNGGGLGLIDYDNDDDLDLFVANGATMANPDRGPGCRLYANEGGLVFRDVTAEAGIDLHRWAMGVTVADYNGDGFDDLYITCLGPNVLLKNEQGTFVDVTRDTGVGGDRWSTSAAFGDIDKDGDLDLYVVNYLAFDLDHPPSTSRFKDVEVMAGPNGLTALPDVVYRNVKGRFRDVTMISGCLTVDSSYGLGVVIHDFSGDGWPDIFVGNDSKPNFIFINDGQASFENRGTSSGLAANADGQEQATMGIALADVDGNGRADIFTTNFSSDTNTLQLDADGVYFDDRTAQYGLGIVSRPYLGWSCGFYDFNHDGAEDLFIVNGHVYPQATPDIMNSSYEQTPLLFLRDGKRFRQMHSDDTGGFLAETHRDRAAVFGDLDRDGDIDVVVGELNGQIRIIRNDRFRGNWLIVELHDPRDYVYNRRGIGAEITVSYRDKVMRRWIVSGGFQSSSAPYAHYGIPIGVNQVFVNVVWPDGLEQRLGRVSVKRYLKVVRPRK